MAEHDRHAPQFRTLCAAVAGSAAIALIVALGPGSASGTSLGQLGSELSQTQAQEGTLSASLGALRGQIGQLESQITLLQNREAAVRTTLADDQARLLGTRTAAGREHARLVRLRARLARARRFLAAQLVSSYEHTGPSLITVVLNARGFNDLLERMQYLNDAERAQQRTIVLTRAAKAQALAATARLMALEHTDAKALRDTYTQAEALAGMNQLLDTRQSALMQAQAAQQTTLAAVQARGAQIRQTIATEQAQQRAAAAAQAAEEAAQSSDASGATYGPSSGWAIPAAIVLCESGGQNLPPNAAGASGYYQIIPSTWRLFGGSGPAAYLAPKAAQDAVAARIWNGGAGASNWVCARIVGD
jgi:septal ring factor EnvC (AmiA/AmiB activator)